MSFDATLQPDGVVPVHVQRRRSVPVSLPVRTRTCSARSPSTPARRRHRHLLRRRRRRHRLLRLRHRRHLLASLVATVGTGDGFTITLTMNGAKVTHLEAGTYEVEVHDNSTFHNFHLTGPGVEKSTDGRLQGHDDLARHVHGRRLQVRLRPARGADEGRVHGRLRAATAAAPSAAGQMQGPEGDREEAPGREAHDRPGALPRRTCPESPLAQGPRPCRLPEPARRREASAGARA